MQHQQQLIHIIRNSVSPIEPLGTGLEHEFSFSLDSIKVILFDIYGTLFISASGDIDAAEEPSTQEAAIRELLHRYEIDRTPSQMREQFLIQVKKEHHRCRAREIDYPEVQYPGIWASILGWQNQAKLEIFSVEYEMIVNPVYPMPRLKEVLHSLQQRGVMMGLISNAQFFTPLLFPALLGNSIAELGIDSRLLLYSYICRYSKPSLHMFNQAREVLSSMGFSPYQVGYIGNDMGKDIYPAQQTGFKGILYAGDKRSLRLREKELPNIKPDGVITSLDQIL